MVLQQSEKILLELNIKDINKNQPLLNHKNVNMVKYEYRYTTSNTHHKTKTIPVRKNT